MHTVVMFSKIRNEAKTKQTKQWKSCSRTLMGFGAAVCILVLLTSNVGTEVNYSFQFGFYFACYCLDEMVRSVSKPSDHHFVVYCQ